MKNGHDTNLCIFGEELVAYIYDELSLANRNSLEVHLLNCSECAAELAEISISRLGIFEWHRDEFVHVATPRFSIPYEPVAVVEPRRPSYFDAVRGVFTSPLRVAFAGSLFAAIVVTAAFLFLGSNPDSDVLAGKTESVLPIVGPIAVESVSEKPDPHRVVISNDERSAKLPENREIKTVVPVRQARAIQAKARTTRKSVQAITTSAQNAPRLGNFVEPEDTSLRLSDLVADIDTKYF